MLIWCYFWSYKRFSSKYERNCTSAFWSQKVSRVFSREYLEKNVKHPSVKLQICESTMRVSNEIYSIATLLNIQALKSFFWWQKKVANWRVRSACSPALFCNRIVPLHVLPKYDESLYGKARVRAKAGSLVATERSVSACLTNNSRRDMSVILPSWEDASIFHAVLASLRESPTVAGKVTMAGLFLWIPGPYHTSTFPTDSASPVGSRLHCLLVSYFHAFKFLIKCLIPSRWRFACRAYQEPWKVQNVCGMGCPSFFSVDCGDFW